MQKLHKSDEPISPEIKGYFDAILIEKAIPKEHHYHFRKWLRYYFDFCFKYNHLQTSKESLTLFIKKLKDKKQNADQQKQASRAISLYYELESKQTGKRKPFNNKTDDFSSEKSKLKATGKVRLSKRQRVRSISDLIIPFIGRRSGSIGCMLQGQGQL